MYLSCPKIPVRVQNIKYIQHRVRRWLKDSAHKSYNERWRKIFILSIVTWLNNDIIDNISIHWGDKIKVEIFPSSLRIHRYSFVQLWNFIGGNYKFTKFPSPFPIQIRKVKDPHIYFLKFIFSLEASSHSGFWNLQSQFRKIKQLVKRIGIKTPNETNEKKNKKAVQV